MFEALKQALRAVIVRRKSTLVSLNFQGSTVGWSLKQSWRTRLFSFLGSLQIRLGYPRAQQVSSKGSEFVHKLHILHLRLSCSIKLAGLMRVFQRWDGMLDGPSER